MYYEDYDIYDDYGATDSDSDSNSDMTIELSDEEEDNTDDTTELEDSMDDEEHDTNDEVRLIEQNLTRQSSSNAAPVNEIIQTPSGENKYEDIISSTQADSENCCIICTEMWTNSEDHHVVSLKCGHLFGKSCIENWLCPSRRTNRCPQCNKPAKKRDIHKIYARCLKPLDTWQRDEALSKVKFLQDKAQKIENELSTIKAKCDLLSKENDKLKLELMNSVMKNKSIATFNSHINGQKIQSQIFKIVYLKEFDIKESGCRLHCYSKLIGSLAISVQNFSNVNSMFPKYGIKKLQLEYLKSETIFIHNKPIKDMFINQCDGTLFTVSLDKTLKITSLISKSVISSINLSNEPWSVHFCPSKNLIYTGLKNGDVIIYDKRNSSKHLSVLTSSTQSPVVSLTNIDYVWNDIKYSGLLSTQLDTCTMYQFSNLNDPAQSDYKSYKLPFEGKFSSSYFDIKSGLTLISCRPSQKHQNVTHYTFDCNSENDMTNISPNVVNVFEGGNIQIRLSKSKIFTCPSNDDLTIVCAVDESTNGALIWDCKSSFSQKITTPQPVWDIELIENGLNSNSSLLSCLHDNKIRLYKICKG